MSIIMLTCMEIIPTIMRISNRYFFSALPLKGWHSFYAAMEEWIVWRKAPCFRALTRSVLV